MKKKIILAAIVILILLFISGCTIGNRNIGFDTTQTFKKFILFVNNDTIRGYVKSWRDLKDSDTIQFTDTNGITYLTHYSNVILTTGEIN